MDTGKSSPCVFYLDRDKAFFYQNGLSSLGTISFSQEALSAGEVINSEIFIETIQTFLRQINIKPTEVIIVLSQQMTFDDDFPEQITQDSDSKMEQFLEIVPFEESISKLFKLEKKTKVVAINKELCDNIQIAFSKLGYVIVGITSFSILKEIFPDLANNVDLAKIAQKIDSVKQYNLSHTDAVINKKVETKEKPSHNKRIYALFGIFGILFSILIFTIINNINTK